MDVFQKLQYDLQVDINSSKKAGNPSEIETIQKELALTKTYLQQAEIDRENLKKQLEFYMSRRKPSNASNWTPYPTMARHFSDSEDDANERYIVNSSQKIIEISNIFNE